MGRDVFSICLHFQLTVDFHVLGSIYLEKVSNSSFSLFKLVLIELKMIGVICNRF